MPVARECLYSDEFEHDDFRIRSEAKGRSPGPAPLEVKTCIFPIRLRP